MGPVKLFLGAFAVLLTTLTVALSYFTVGEAERAVITRWGQVRYVAGPGLGFKVPFTDSATYYSVAIESMTPKQPVNTYTVDNQEVDATFTVFYRIPADHVDFLYKHVPDYDMRLMSLTTDRFKVEMGKVNITEVANKRGEIRDRIKHTLTQDARAMLGLDITDFQITNIDFTKQYRAAVDQAALAKTDVEKQEQLKRSEEVKADTRRIEAKGMADAKVLAAEAEAKAIKLHGEAQAAAIKAQAEALKQNSELVELEKAKRWNGSVPHMVMGGGVPFFNIPADIMRK